MAEGRTYSLHPQLDIRQILQEAKIRWLRPSEICEILRNYKQFQLTTDPPYKPCGGSLYLFDRKALRYFRKDGHHWRKKKDGKTVREAHEKLKSGSVDVLHCYYAHGEDNENFQRRSYWLLDGNLEHIVLVHYRDVDEGSRSGISHLLNADSQMLDHIQGSQNSSAAFSAQRNSCNFASQASYASSSGTADLSGQTRSSEYEDPDSGDDFVGSSLVGTMSCSGLNIASMSGNDREENNVATSSSHPYAGVPTNLRGLNGPCSSFYGSQVDAQYVTESVQQNVIYGASQIADIFGGACSSSYTAPSIWPEILCSNREFSNLQDKTFSFERSDDAGAVAKNMTDSLFDSSGLVTYVAEGGYQFILDAHVQMSVGDGSTQAQLKEENAEGVNCPVNKHLEGGAPHSCQSLNEQFFHMTPSLKNDSKSQATVTATDQPIDSEAVASSALKDPLRGDMHNDEHGGFRKLDSFGRWMDKEIGRDCDDSLMSSDSASYWNVLQTQSDDKEVSNITKHMQLDTDSLGPSLSQEQLFSILDFSPDWAFSGVETKILITGTFLGGIDPSSIKWGCMFGEDEVSAELLMSNVLRCQVPVRALGRVPFYVTCSDRLACSQIREFEYRENSFFGSSSLESEPENEICFQVHLAKMLLLGVDRKGPFCSTESCHKCNLIDDLFLSLRDAEDGWDTLVQDSNAFQGCPRDPRDALIEKLLKGWLLEWLANKVHEEGKGPNVLNADGLGIIHITAALGYEWAISPIITAGVNPNFRDARGRTALHWAAYFGREETVVTLVGLGASPGAVEDPTSKFPGGRTAADLASSRGHKGIAGYLAEEDLTSHLSTLALKENVMDSVSANLAAEKAVESIKDQDVAFLGRNNKEQLTLRGSLAAVRNSAQAAARIQAAFRVHSFRQRKIMESNDGNVESMDVAILLPSVNNKIQKMSHFNDSLHAAAIKIQQKYRGYVGRKEFLKIRNRIVRIQAHVRGHQVRKQYKKVVWSVSIVEKAILRWRRKGAGLRGFRADKPIEPVGLEFQKTDEYDFLRHGRKQKVAGVEKALARVQSMVRYPEARDQYMRLVASSHKSKLGDGGKQYAQGPDQERKIDEDLSAPMIH